MKNRGGVISMKKGGVAKQMEMFEPVERGFDRGGMGLRKVETGEVFDFNAIANDYNQSIGRDIISGEEMSALFDAFLDMKTAAKASGMNEGGLAEEGGSVDPVSGNSVPPGSTKEEVRDDIPAQLSEGEFVFPADVVRYIGLEKLMMMRQEAKMGLAAMEAMGQMGNSEEATMPDDLPFDMYDLDIEDDNDYNMAQGGVVKMKQGGTNYTPPTTGGYVAPPPVTTGFSGPPPVQPFQSGQTQFKVAGAGEGAVTPKTAVDPVIPTFSDFVGQNIPGVDFTMVTFYDETGSPTILKKFPDGSFEDPKNPGKKVSPADMGLTEEIKTTPTTQQQRVETAKVVDDPGDDKDDPPPPATDVTGIGYNNSKLSPELQSVISDYGAGFGTLKDAFNNQIYDIALSKLGVTEGVPSKTNAITSATFGGVLDAYRGIAGFDVDPRTGAVSRNYTDKRSMGSFGNTMGTTPLDQLTGFQQNQIATVARAVHAEVVSNFINPETNEAYSKSETQANLEASLAEAGLTPEEIDTIANRGGNFNKNQKMARALSTITTDKKSKEADTVQQSMTDYASIVSGRGDDSDKFAGDPDKSGKTTQDAADAYKDDMQEKTGGTYSDEMSAIGGP